MSQLIGGYRNATHGDLAFGLWPLFFETHREPYRWSILWFGGVGFRFPSVLVRPVSRPPSAFLPAPFDAGARQRGLSVLGWQVEFRRRS